MADSDKDVLITPNTSQTSQPEVKFVGKDNSPMYLKVLDDNTLSFEGTEGQVFSISPTMSSGDIFSVNDISGIQSIAVNADGTVAIAPVSGNVGIGTSSPGDTLHLTGGQGYMKFGTSGSKGHVKSDYNLELYADDGGNNSATYQNIKFFTAGSNERMRIDSAGNVGIGTTSPSAPLHIYTTSTSQPSLLVENDEAQAPADAIIRLLSAGGSDTWIDFTQNTYGQLEITGGGSTRRQILTVDDPDTADACTISLNKEHYDWNTQIFGDSSTPAIFVEGGNSNVGIGTTTPDEALEIMNGALKITREETESGSVVEDHVGLSVAAGLKWTFSQAFDDPNPVPIGTTTDNDVRIIRNNTTHQYFYWDRTYFAKKVGIGTTTIDAPFHVKKADDLLSIFESTDANAGIQIDSPNDGYSVVFFAEGGTNKWSVGKLGSSSDKFSIYDEVNSAARLVIDTSGNVGIGETSPVFASGGGLHIQNSSQANLRLEDDSTEYFDVAMQNGDAYLINRVSDGIMSLRTNGTERLKIAAGGAITFNQEYTFPTSDGSANQVLQTDGNGALSFATVSGGSDTNTFVIVGEEGDNYSGTGSTGNANGYQFSYGNGAQNVSKSSSGADFGINVPVDCTLTRVDVVFANSGNVSTGTTTFVVVKNGTSQSGNLSTNHSAGIHDTHHTGLSHSFSAGDRFNLRTTTSSRQVGPMRMTAYFTPT